MKLDPKRRQRLAGGFVAVLGVLAILVPFWPELDPEKRLGLLLLAAAAMEFFHGLRRSDPKERRGAWIGGSISMVLGGLLLNAALLMDGMLVVGLAGWLALDGTRHATAAVRAWRAGQPFAWSIAAAASYLIVAAGLVLLRDQANLWSVAIAVALRLFATAAGMFRAAVHQAGAAGEGVLQSFGLADRPELQALAAQLEEQDRARGPIDRYWVWTFVLTLFAIHLGRMGMDRSALGIVSPGVAVVGDLVVALFVGLGVNLPLHIVGRTVSKPFSRRAWDWCLAEPEARRRRLSVRGGLRWLLKGQLRRTIRLRRARYSARSTLRQGLQMGLPTAAVIAAVTPVLGMSWYFDTENYASGIWNSWARSRTDTWREAMIHAASNRARAEGRPEPTMTIEPPGVGDGADFAFIVIGDTGEGDASQHVLRDQLIAATLQPEVRFVLLSSDVIYPSGEMKDYEAKFWLPFKGVTKPVYAIPGNHDWFDALEGFAATFFDPESARTAMRARVEVDHKVTTTNDKHIELLIAKAARLRDEYRVPTGLQEGPFFQISTDGFALIAVDSGISKRLDGPQFAWLRYALEAARGKFKMVILGHPIFACGEYRATDNPDFAAVHRLLREHDVQVVMAGDTHDFEYYREQPIDGPVMHHFVNGGGGAFLTMGVQFVDATAMPTDEWAFYPATAPLIAKNEANNPFWKQPMWWWLTELKAWPSAPEWVSAAFDYNVAPYFQSFAEVRVEPSRKQIRVLPWGVHGRLRWSDFQRSAGLAPSGSAADALAEWIFPMN